ncbi:MAG: hypothetical protein HDR88_02980 [Bacteroides sp.]|nr:hypothetical protein [Bacteroides sp.]
MNDVELNKLIDRYFNAETTLEEEKILRNMLLSRSCLSNSQKEALAVMGYYAFNTKKKRIPIRLFSMYAAVIGAIILLVITFFIYPNDDQVAEVTCIAYVRGIEIRDKSKIMQLVAEQLSEMSIVSAEMTDEINNNFNDLRNVLNSEEL